VRVSVGVPNATVTLRGAGARRRVKTGANGRAAISVKARRSARVTVRAVACAGRLRVAVRTTHTS
jgi:hypothetical protein